MHAALTVLAAGTAPPAVPHVNILAAFLMGLFVCGVVFVATWVLFRTGPGGRIREALGSAAVVLVCAVMYAIAIGGVATIVMLGNGALHLGTGL